MTISYKTKVARMLFIIVIIFILLHIPFTVLIFLRTARLNGTLVMNQLDDGYYILDCISHYSLYLNAAINPIIYGLTNDNFRRAYHQTPILPSQITRWIHNRKQFQHQQKVHRFFYCLFFSFRKTFNFYFM